MTEWKIEKTEVSEIVTFYRVCRLRYSWFGWRQKWEHQKTFHDEQTARNYVRLITGYPKVTGVILYNEKGFEQ